MERKNFFDVGDDKVHLINDDSLVSFIYGKRNNSNRVVSHATDEKSKYATLSENFFEVSMIPDIKIKTYSVKKQ